MIAVECCETCGTPFEPLRKWNSGNPVIIMMPTCTCEEDATSERVDRMIENMKRRREEENRDGTAL